MFERVFLVERGIGRVRQEVIGRWWAHGVSATPSLRERLTPPAGARAQSNSVAASDFFARFQVIEIHSFGRT